MRFRVLLLLASVLVALPVRDRAQSTPSDNPPVGILVTGSAEKAGAARRALEAGANFAVLAKEQSIDPSSEDGGSLGLLKDAHLSPELQRTLLALRPGQVTPVVRVAAGFAVYTVFAAAPSTHDLEGRKIQDLTVAGTVDQGISLSGADEAGVVFNAYPKEEGWNRDLSRPCAIRKASLAEATARTRAFLSSPAGEAASPVRQQQALAALAQLYAYTGDMEASIAAWKQAYDIAQAGAPGTVPYTLESLGVSLVHLSEMQNGAYRDGGKLDIFPPVEPGTAFRDETASREAIHYLEAYLALVPDDLDVRWQLNLAYLTVGGYPAKVPARYLIPPAAFASKENIGRFQDVALPAGLNAFSQAGGIVIDDFDGQGRLDVVASSWDMCEPLHLFHNNGDGTFTDRAAAAGLGDQLGGLNLVQADYNNDGCMDLLVLRGGWQQPMRRSLLRNNCNGSFTDVTDASGLGGVVTATQTAVWADIDNDGRLDLFLGNENAPSQLFRNKGDGTFEDISHAAGIDQTAFSKGVVAADYDKDGFVDFYVSNATGPNFLYHNNHDGTFTDVARQAGVQAPYFSFATWFFDYDNDGWPDLFVDCYFNSVQQVIRSRLGLPVSVETMKLYRNRHDGSFEDVTPQVGLDKVFMPMGANFGDVDNDGYLDVYLGMGNPSFGGVLPHALLRNRGGKEFVDITASSGTGELHKGHGVAFADLERRGVEDIVASNGGAVPADQHTLRLFRNPGSGNDWLNLRLIGEKSNRSAVGAEIKVTVQNDGHPRLSLYRTVGASSSFGGNPMEQHIGLGRHARILSLDIRWPATGTSQHFDRVAKNEFLAIHEFATGYTRLTPAPVRLRGAVPTSGGL